MLSVVTHVTLYSVFFSSQRREALKNPVYTSTLSSFLSPPEWRHGYVSLFGLGRRCNCHPTLASLKKLNQHETEARHTENSFGHMEVASYLADSPTAAISLIYG